MAEVKRYDLIVEPFSWADETKVDDYNPALREATAGLVVYSSDHDRIVSRLQREKAKLLVRCLELMAEKRHQSLEYGGIIDWKKRGELFSRCRRRIRKEEKRLYRLARYIAAKYLGER